VLPRAPLPSSGQRRGRHVIEIFFDFISPYSYLACTKVRALGQRLGHSVEPRPVLLAGILDALGTKGPAEVPPRRAYIIKNLLRAAHRAGVTISLPPTHPFNPLLALRVASLELDEAVRWRVIDALFAATWGGGAGIESPNQLVTALRAAGLDPRPLMTLAAGAAAKDQLRKNTVEALARGAFGVPTLFVDSELFFGFDSFPDLEAFVRGKDPAAENPALIERWSTLPASAVRRKSG
jgi:2-hydroxychromene-2-carboxylate isomerase